MEKKLKNIVIIGGGPAGLIAAQILSEKSGYDVHLYEQKPSVGRKFLIAGRGGLNLTHSEHISEFLKRYGPAQDFLKPHIEAFSPDDLKTWATNLKIETFIGSSGRVFPVQMKATPLMRAWTSRLTNQNVHVHLQHRFMGFSSENTLIFKNKSDAEISALADAVLFAAGGASYPHLGATGSWTDTFENKGIELAPFRPINCGYNVNWSEHLSRKFEGHPLKNIDVCINGEKSHGDLIVTSYGLEGGAIYGISRALNNALEVSDRPRLHLDLRPNLDVEQILKKLNIPRKKQSFSTFLRKQLKLSPVEIALIWEVCDKDSIQNPERLAAFLKKLPVTVQSARPIARAISSMGGIKLSEFDEHLMLKKHPGWFAAGEMIDWDAPTGGYLLQACFSTGVAAAKGIQNWLD